MKKRRNIIAALTLCAVLSFTACGGNTGSGNTSDENNTTQTADSVTESKGNEDDLEAQLTDLYNQEQQILMSTRMSGIRCLIQWIKAI